MVRARRPQVQPDVLLLDVAMSACSAAAPPKTSAKRFTALDITLATVKNHLTIIFDKTGVSSRLELAMFALRQGLLNK